MTESMWKEAVVAYFKAQFQDLPVKTKENKVLQRDLGHYMS
jgi:hypothetical protein